MKHNDDYLFDVEDDLKKISLHQITAGSDFKTGHERETQYKIARKIKVNIKKSLKELFKSRRYKTNLAISIWLWMAAFTNSMIVSSYESPGAISESAFNIDIFNSSVNLLGCLISGLVIRYLLRRKKFIFTISYTLALFGLAGIFFTHRANSEPGLTLSSVSKVVAQFSMASVIQGNFMMMEIFPSVFQATSFGICNTFGVLIQMINLKLLPYDFYLRFGLGLGIIIVSLGLSPFMIGSHHIKL